MLQCRARTDHSARNRINIANLPNGKSPGPDRYTAEFYKRFVKSLVSDLLLSFKDVMNREASLSPLNSSYITLIPKQETPTKPEDFRPISLIHGVQKIFSKILANRLQHRMHKIIDNAQTSFLKNKQMAESFIYAQQVLNRARLEKVPMALHKADIRKAFDTLSWDFLLQTMQHLGFPELWISWIRRAVLPGTSQIIINGLLGKKLNLRRGVRQEDPLSPLLFIIAIDFLAKYFMKLASTNTIRLPYSGMKPCLLYADEALFFIKSEVQQLQTLQIALAVFQNISGLTMNPQKSELLISYPQPKDTTQLSLILGCRLGEFPFTYLGLPHQTRGFQKRPCYH